MKELKRTKVGNFSINQSIKISDIEKDETLVNKNCITIETFFETKQQIILNDDDLKKFLNGVKIFIPKKDEIYRIYDKNLKFIGIGKVFENKLKRDIC